THQKSIAIRRGMSDERRGYHRTSTRAIFDNYCLSQPFADALGCKSRDQVIRATGPKSHHPPDGTIRPIGPCRWRTDKPNKQAGATQEPAYHPFTSVDAAIRGPSLPRTHRKSSPSLRDVRLIPSVCRYYCGGMVAR